MTLKDYDELKHEEIPLMEKRSLLRIFCDYMYLKHPLISPFVFFGISFPFHLRITKLFLTIHLNLLLNALLFFETMIKERNDTKIEKYLNVSIILILTIN